MAKTSGRLKGSSSSGSAPARPKGTLVGGGEGVEGRASAGLRDCVKGSGRGLGRRPCSSAAAPPEAPAPGRAHLEGRQARRRRRRDAQRRRGRNVRVHRVHVPPCRATGVLLQRCQLLQRAKVRQRRRRRAGRRHRRRRGRVAVQHGLRCAATRRDPRAACRPVSVHSSGVALSSDLARPRARFCPGPRSRRGALASGAGGGLGPKRAWAAQWRQKRRSRRRASRRRHAGGRGGAASGALASGRPRRRRRGWASGHPGRPARTHAPPSLPASLPPATLRQRPPPSPRPRPRRRATPRHGSSERSACWRLGATARRPQPRRTRRASRRRWPGGGGGGLAGLGRAGAYRAQARPAAPPGGGRRRPGPPTIRTHTAAGAARPLPPPGSGRRRG
jgi:hypothetical protein